MEFHRGRLIDHIQLRASDLQRSRAFYVAVLECFGLRLEVETPEAFGCDDLYVSAAGDKPPTTTAHIAFQADSQETVQRFYRAALAAGGRDNGAPGLRDYHPNYYAAFVFDPDGNNIEAVFHGPSTRSAASVVIRPA